MNTPSIQNAQRFNDRTLIESLVSSFFILDYGFIKEVNPDKTVNVTHAKKLKKLNGESLKAMETKNVEVLTIAGKGFSLNFDYNEGDKVLLLGLKNYIKEVDKVTSATETDVYCHYSRETLKALPLCVFNEDAKVTIDIDAGDLTLDAEGDITIKCKNAKVEAESDAEIKCSNATVKTDSFKVTGSGGGSAALEVTP